MARVTHDGTLSLPQRRGIGETSFRRRAGLVLPGRARLFRTARLMAGLALAGGLLAACTQADSDRSRNSVMRVFNPDHRPELQVLEQTTDFALVPASRSLVHAPDALIVLQRSLGGAMEQRIVLPNATAMQGDNTIQVRAQTRSTARLSEFSLEDVTARFGGLPAPFTSLQASALQSGRDELGAFTYATQQVGTGTTCVLVLRRLTGSARPLPQGAEALDVVMRNCVPGSVEQALAPLGGRSLSVGGAPQRTIHTLSPHAAPRG
ncbi:MAG: cellulose biosynthesis protein BcsN [Pararhodobacter sp.]